ADAGVAEGAGKRAAARDLHHREVAGLEERVHPSQQIRRRNLVELRDAFNLRGLHEFAGPVIEPRDAGNRGFEHALDTAARVVEALQNVEEGAFTLVGWTVSVNIDLGKPAKELSLH